MRIIPRKGKILFFGKVVSFEGESSFLCFLPEVLVVFRQEIPVLGIDTELVLFPVELTV